MYIKWGSWIIFNLLDVMVCCIAKYFNPLFAFWLELQACQYTAELVRYSVIPHTRTSNKIFLLISNYKLIFFLRIFFIKSLKIRLFKAIFIKLIRELYQRWESIYKSNEGKNYGDSVISISALDITSYNQVWFHLQALPTVMLIT